MDKDAILQAAQAARTYTQEVGGKLFTVQIPSAHEMRLVYLRAGSHLEDPALVHVILREALKTGITGWSKVTVDDLLKNGDSEVAAFDPALVPLLLDAQDDWRQELDQEFTKRITARNGSLESAQKN